MTIKIMTSKIKVPQRIVDICSSWHSGQSCPLYSIASTGEIHYSREKYLWACGGVKFADFTEDLLELVEWIKENVPEAGEEEE
jgi:hypothetical protein